MKIGLLKISVIENEIPVEKIIGIDLQSWQEEQLEGNKPFLYSEELPENYFDISNDLQLVEKYGEEIMHYNSKRNFMLPLFYSEAGSSLENFAAMSLEKKMIAARYFFIPYEIRLQLLSEAEDAANWKQLVELTQEGRALMVEKMRITTSDYVRRELMPKINAQHFFNDYFLLLNSFIKSASYDFENSLSNKVGTIYENDGFAQKDYYNGNLKNDLILILNS